MRLIDADALMPKLKAILEAENQIYGRASWDFSARCVQAVENAPTIESERKRGEWKPIGWSGRIHKCNQCGNMLDFGGVNAGRGDANFCPNCGADMREGNP